jgi:hypothetical protein
MAYDKIKLFNVVALLEELPDDDLQRGDMGTIVEFLPPYAIRLSLIMVTVKQFVNSVCVRSSLLCFANTESL